LHIYSPLANPADIEALLQRATDYENKGRYLEALSFYQDIAMNQDTWKVPAPAAVHLGIARIHSAYLNDNDTALAALPPFPRIIRVLVEQTAEPVTVAADTELAVTPAGTFPVMTIPAGTPVLLSADNSTILLNTHTRVQGMLAIASPAGNAITINGKPYWGSILARAAESTLVIINQVDLEQYLEGVLPREVSPSWPDQALQAQAVAARTYALYHMIKRRGAPFDVYATTSSQVYGGKAGESPKTHAAIAATQGRVLTRQGKIILALFHANSGGRTEAVHDIWGFTKPYLVSVDDRHSMQHPGDAWEKTFTADELQELIRAFGLPAGSIGDIVPVEKAASGRINKIKITQDGACFFLSGNSFRLIVGPGKVKSTRFEVAKRKGKFVFTGTGYGHGAGMSQWGAYALAKQGHDFRQILALYYPGAVIESIEAR
jgi:stage II sporulation protein D